MGKGETVRENMKEGMGLESRRIEREERKGKEKETGGGRRQ